MTTAERNALKIQALDDCIATLRHIVRHNGAAITANAGIGEIADHALDINPDNVKTLWTDINTIDRVKQILNRMGWTVDHRRNTWKMPRQAISMTAEELMEYAVNDERLTAENHSWAVVKITKTGTEILTYGGNFYQLYDRDLPLTEIYPYTEVVKLADPTQYGLEEAGNYFMLEGLALEAGRKYRATFDSTLVWLTMEEAESFDAFCSNTHNGLVMDAMVQNGNTFIKVAYSDEIEVPESAGIKVELEELYYVQSGTTERLLKQLESEDAAWMSEFYETQIHGHPTYTEGADEFVQIPCDLPGNFDQLISITIARTKTEDGSDAAPLEYSLTELSCDTSNEGMIGLPHGMWLIYDNSNLKSAPQALLIPKTLAEGTDTGFRFEKVMIAYNRLASGLERLHLVGDSFGDEYIVSAIDITFPKGGTWKE